MIQLEKATLRRRMRARRRALDAAVQRRAAIALANRLERLWILGPGRRVAFYFAGDGEIDPAPLMRRARRVLSICLVPVVPAQGRILRFAEVKDDTKLRPNRFGIPEPVAPAGELYRAAEIDLVLLPLVAFDDHGNRLGMGGGFYDSTLAIRTACRRFRRPRVIGLAHECQHVDRIATEPWDIPLDLIATDRRIYSFGTSE